MIEYFMNIQIRAYQRGISLSFTKSYWPMGPTFRNYNMGLPTFYDCENEAHPHGPTFRNCCQLGHPLEITWDSRN